MAGHEQDCDCGQCVPRTQEWRCANCDLAPNDCLCGPSRALVLRPCLQEPTHDPVHSPSHYTAGGIECIDYLRAKLSVDEFRGFLRGNALKYLMNRFKFRF